MLSQPVNQQSTAGPRKFGALRHRDFTLLWSGLLISNAGTWMQSVAQGWLAYALTNSPIYLGLLGASFAVPMILLPIFGGTIADRFNRLGILKITQTIMMLAAVAMATLAYLRVITIWEMIAVSFLSSVALAVDNPTRQALIPDLVPRQELLSAISLNSVAFNGAALVGPAIAGILIGGAASGDASQGLTPQLYSSTALVFYVNALSYLAVLGPVFIMRPTAQAHGRTGGIQNAVFEGFEYVKARPALLLLLVLSAAMSVFGRSFSQLLPVFARDILQVGTEGYGLMLALPGAGTLLAGFGIAAIGHYLDRRKLILFSLLALVITIVAFALSRSFSLSLALLTINGFAATVFGAVVATIIQLETEGRLRGRVMSLYTITVIGMGPLGSLISGSLATVIPVSYAVAIPALVILFFLVYAVKQPTWKDVK
jgi:MFS family permease